MPIPLLAVFFLNPLTFAATAAGAVSLPLIIHLLNRRRFRIVPWAAMRFLLAAQKQNTRRLRIEQILLLAMRISIVLLIILAMASVTKWAEKLWEKTLPDGSTLLTPGSKRTHRIIVLDGSMSMGLKVRDTTCFERARDLARRIVKESERGDGFSVVLMASSPRRVVGGNAGPAEDSSRVLDELDAMRLPHGNSDLAGTLETVHDLLRRSPTKFVEKEVWFLSDLQKASWELRSSRQVATAMKDIREKARTVVLDVGNALPSGNLAVLRLETAGDRPVALTRSPTTFKATVRNYGEQLPEQVGIVVRIGRAAEKQGDPPFALREHRGRPQSLVRGVNTVSFTHTFDVPGDYIVQFAVEGGDDLDLDDSRSIVLRVRDHVPVMLVNGKTAADPYDRATEYLYDALNPYQDGPPPADAPLRPTTVSTTEFADPEKCDLSNVDCVFLCDVQRLSFREVQRLEAHVLRGGGVVFCMGPNVDLKSYDELLFRNGNGLLPGRLLGRHREPKGHQFRFTADDREWKLAPLAVFDARETDRANLLESVFHEFVRVEPAAAVAGHAPRRVLSFMTVSEKLDAGRPSEVTTYQREPALLDWQPRLENEKDRDPESRTPRAIPSGRGRVALLTTTANTDWTDWPRKGSYIWLMQELAAHVASPRLRGRSAVVGETLEHYLDGPPGAEEKEVAVTTPDQRKDVVRTIRRDDAAVLFRWTDTDISGIYRAVVGAHPRDYLHAVNVPTVVDQAEGGESDLVRTSEEELKALYPEWEFQIVRDPGEASKDGKKRLLSSDGEPAQPKLGTAVAHWLLILAFVVIVAESVLAWYFGHYSAAHERDAAGVGTTPRPGWVPALVGSSLGILGVFALMLGFVLIHALVTGDFMSFLPDAWRRSIEDGLEVPEPAPGEGTKWGLEFLPYLWSETADVWLAPVLALAVGGLVVLLYLREARVMGAASPRARVGRIAVLCGLRIGLIVLMLLVLMPQMRVTFERQSWPDIVILIDDSASMSEVDRYRDPKVKEMADELARIDDLTRPQRLQLAQALLTRGERDIITRLLVERQAKIHVYHCSAHASRIGTVSKEDEAEAVRDGIRGLEALSQADSSRLGASVRQVLNDFRGASLSAVVMLTDGVTTEGEDLQTVAKYAAQQNVPLYFVGIGDQHESRDVVVSELEVARTVFVNDTLVFRFNVAVKGYGDQLAAVKVRLKDETGKEELASQVVTVDQTGKPVKVRLDYKPTAPGDRTFVVETDIRPDEVNKRNNSQKREVWVTETRMIKVLYVEGCGRWEFRDLKTLLERESDRVKNNKTMDLKFWLQDSDPQFPLQDKNALAELPTKAELGAYDVVILGDVDPNPREHPKTAQFLKDLVDFVREKGGGLLMLSGERHAPHAYKDSPLRDVLPIDVQSDRPPEEPEGGRTESYKPDLTPIGRVHPIFSFNEKDNDPIWRNLQGMYWHAEGIQPKRAAEVLVAHPTKKGTGPAGKENRLPLVVHHFVGDGRAMFFGFCETWRWRFREDEQRYNQFWIQTVRYLARTRQGRVELRLDRQGQYLRGEPIKVTVRFPDEEKPPPEGADVRVTVLNRDIPEQRTMKLVRIDNSRGTFEGTLTQTPVGRYEFTLSRPSVKPIAKAETEVVAPPGEMQRLRMNQSEMESAARETRGAFYTLADADRVIDDVKQGPRVSTPAPGRPWTLWNLPVILLAVLLCLGVEWVLRKMHHLL